MRDMWVDFNDVDRKGQTMTLLKFATPEANLAVGASVLVGDDEGSECRGVIVGVTDQAVYLQLDLGTFQATEHAAAVCA